MQSTLTDWIIKEKYNIYIFAYSYTKFLSSGIHFLENSKIASYVFLEWNKLWILVWASFWNKQFIVWITLKKTYQDLYKRFDSPCFMVIDKIFSITLISLSLFFIIFLILPLWREIGPFLEADLKVFHLWMLCSKFG